MPPADAALGVRPSKRAKGKGKGGGAAATWKPNVWIYFPTYHGERERFNGFCGARDAREIARDRARSSGGRDRSPRVTAAAITTTATLSRAEDKQCTCTGKLATCHRHRECRDRHECAIWPKGSAVHVERARAFAAALRAKVRPSRLSLRPGVCVSAVQLGYSTSAQGRLAGRSLSGLRVTAFYDDCWENRGRCQGMRPCQEPVDQAWTCRATAMVCPERRWADALAAAKVRPATLT